MRKFSLLLLACLMSLTMLSSSSYADDLEVDPDYADGLLSGSLPAIGIDNATNPEFITDDDMETFGVIRGGASENYGITYDLGSAKNIERIAIKFFSANVSIYFNDDDDNQIIMFSGYDITGQSGDLTFMDVDIEGVRYVELTRVSGNYPRINYFNLYETHVPLSVPDGLTMDQLGSDYIDISWNVSDGTSLAGYNVYVDGVKANSELITNNSYTVTGLSPGTQYTITVTAVDTSNNETDPSDPLHIVTLDEPDTTPPAVPSGLTGVPGSTEVELSWTANTEDDLAGYNVYVDGDQVNSDLVTDASYTVTGLTPDTEYSFAVSAVDTSNNESERSAAILITTLDTPPPPPAAPGDVTTTPGPGRVTISWDPVDGAIGYNVYVDGVQANTDLITGTSYTITGLDPDTEYNFTVTAVGAGGESDTSDPAPSVPDQDNSLDLGSITPIATIGAVIGTAISWITNVIPGWVLLGLGIIFAVVLVRFLFWIVQKIKAETKFKQGKALSTKEYDRLSKEDKDRYTLRALERQDKNLRGANYDKITNDLRTKVDRHDRDRAGRMSTKEFDDKHGRAARQGMYDYLTAKGRIKERDDWVRNTGGWGIRQREGRAGRAGRAGRPGRDRSR